MDPNLPETAIDLPGIDQIGLVVEDLKDGMDRYRSVLGVDPWTVMRFEPPELTDTTYRGETVEYGMLLAVSDVGDMTVELIEPTIGPNTYQTHLNEHGEGLHHVAYFGWDREAALEARDEFEAAGFPVLQQGTIGGSTFWYYDTREALNGLIFEVVAQGEGGGGPGPVAVYPEDPYPPSG